MDRHIPGSVLDRFALRTITAYLELTLSAVVAAVVALTLSLPLDEHEKQVLTVMGVLVALGGGMVIGALRAHTASKEPEPIWAYQLRVAVSQLDARVESLEAASNGHLVTREDIDAAALANVLNQRTSRRRWCRR